ncbi:OmpA family protein [Flavobacterium urocaniciphilum]|uniref:WD40-like Beta Propeller Repeat n=1 Tax=Flavobacterium urocaniciphilum TaxID=1299341 RepID=A0A1H8ZPR3_9FLAO|nr:OmpA family protein [Flavobacterium urocaniciphilum]SEP66297.1 WD40-like Beta Propeller Repeat [Flavobacterium urocaniciphilum]
MIKKIKLTIIALTIFSSAFSQEDNRVLSKGDKLYNNLSYIKSIEVYEKVANSGYKSVELFQKLGDSYFFNSDFLSANKWYAELFQLNEKVDNIYYYRYSQTLKSVGNTKLADEYLTKFAKSNADDTRSKEFNKNKNYLLEIENNSNRFKIENLGINTEFSDYGAAINKDTLVFSSSRLPEKGKSKRDDWTSDYFSALYSATIGKENGKVSNVRFFSEEIQSLFHESSPVFTKDGKTMYFTRNNVLKNKKINSGKVNLLKIFKADFVNGKWTNVTELPFNNNDFNCAHPMLNPDETKLYFVSDMPGGFGDSDIYYVDIQDNGFGLPNNLGNNINTQGKETFPFIIEDELYFSSDGHLGLGGLDVFVTSINDKNFNNKINNIGKPVNSSFDDFSFCKLNNSKYGFFTSNREGGKGKDDIYSFIEIKKLETNTIFEGVVVDKENNEPLQNSTVTIYDKLHNEIGKVTTNDKGEFTFNNVMNKPLAYLKAESTDHETIELSAPNNSNKIILALPRIKNQITKGTDLAKYLNIKDIQFDFDKFNIRRDAEVDLQKILIVMNQFPDINVIIKSHTDSRGSNIYNRKLSEKRAKSTLEYLVSKGINRNRLVSFGFGEDKLLNNCKDGVDCNEEEHQLNRRSEFIVD